MVRNIIFICKIIYWSESFCFLLVCLRSRIFRFFRLFSTDISVFVKNDCTSSNRSDKYINVKSKGELLKLLSIQKTVIWNGFHAFFDCKNALRTQTSNKVESIRTADTFFPFLNLKIEIFFCSKSISCEYNKTIIPLNLVVHG